MVTFTEEIINRKLHFFVGLSDCKATKKREIVQNIQSLVPVAHLGFHQILLSITMLTKTGLEVVVNNRPSKSSKLCAKLELLLCSYASIRGGKYSFL